ncbi:hypothetical protein CLV47_11265 [Antricoccus suffuscus]|uniref:Cytokinin riboside 5'-monophosphate phosphoribohydrolase n=1 Tax=Antricoccus suffuscus TaxID=1629062 RepID=A0A2T0ZXE7_9ACTN|nr:TIGR00730 family Rossman fold protein [Antricoccus suffuscus]PRZ41032.1 hypothetical protein CLV47_11265 [Antricoccus suffuscus]
MTDERFAVCVYCSSSKGIDPAIVDLAAEVGTALARERMIVVSGGGGVSCMGALVRAARAAGGRTEGIITEFLVDLEVADRESDELVVTSSMRERKAEMDRRSDAFVILPGGLGTLEELFEIWTTRGLGEHNRPLYVVDPQGIFDPLFAALQGLCERGLIKPEAFSALQVVRDVPTLIELLRSARA